VTLAHNTWDHGTQEGGEIMPSPRETTPGEPRPLADVDYWLERSATNFAAFFDHLARAMGRHSVRWDDVWAVDACSPWLVLNSALLLRPLDTAQAGDLIARLDRFYGEKPGGPWLLGSGWPSPDLSQWGLQLLDQQPLMVRLPGAALPDAPPELRIVEAINPAILADCERVAIAGFAITELQPVRLGSLFDARALGGPLRIWVGYLGDRPVTTAAVFADGAVNGIYVVTTLSEVRGRGYGTAVTAHAIAASAPVPAVLEASAIGQPVYRRLGFADVVRYDMWMKPR
jgi:hypothetical protein